MGEVSVVKYESTLRWVGGAPVAMVLAKIALVHTGTGYEGGWKLFGSLLLSAIEKFDEVVATAAGNVKEEDGAMQALASPH